MSLRVLYRIDKYPRNFDTLKILAIKTDRLHVRSFSCCIRWRTGKRLPERISRSALNQVAINPVASPLSTVRQKCGRDECPGVREQLWWRSMAGRVRRRCSVAKRRKNWSVQRESVRVVSINVVRRTVKKPREERSRVTEPIIFRFLRVIVDERR